MTVEAEFCLSGYVYIGAQKYLTNGMKNYNISVWCVFLVIVSRDQFSVAWLSLQKYISEL